MLQSGVRIDIHVVNFRRHNPTPMTISKIAIIWLIFLIQFWMSGSIQELQRQQLLLRLFRLNNENQKCKQNFQQNISFITITLQLTGQNYFYILLAKWPLD